MGNTIAPRPVSPPSTSSVRSTSAAPATAAPAPSAPAAEDVFVPNESGEGPRYSPEDYARAAKLKVGDPIKSSKTPDEISKMSNEELGALKGEEITGMTMNQYMAYEKAIDKDGGVGRDNLDPKVGMALARKSFVNNMMLRMLQAGSR